MRKIKLALIFLILLLLTLSVTKFSYAEDGGTPYHRLFQLELTELSPIYKNESIPGFEIFNHAKENKSQYPLYSYTLLLNCYRSVLVDNLTKQIKTMGNKTVSKIFISSVQDNLSNLTTLLNNFVPNTLAALEWFDLARRELKDANVYLNQAVEHHDKSDYNLTIASLVITASSLHKAHGFISLARERNMLSETAMNTSKLLAIVKNVAARWIDLISSTIAFYDSIGYEKYLQHPKLILNQSVDYYSNGLYYVALMNVVYAKALLEYYIHGYLISADYSKTLASCEVYLNCANLTMRQIYDDPDVDAPFAESNFELAQLHLQDAQKEQDKSAATAAARLSIQESIIAKEQALAALDLKNAVEQGFIEEKTSVTSNEILWQYIAVAAIILEAIFICFLLFKKKAK